MGGTLPGSTLATIDPEKVRQLQLLSGGVTPSVPPPSGVGATAGLHPLAKIGATNAATAPTLEGGPQIAPPIAPTSPSLPALNFKQRQSLPQTSPGVTPTDSTFFQNKLERLQDQQANPLGSAENNPTTLGKIGHTLGKIGNVAGEILDPKLTARIPGSDLNRQAQEAALQKNFETASTREDKEAAQKALQEYQQSELGLRTKAETRAQQHETFEEGKPGTPEQESIKDLTGQKNPATGKNYTAEEAEVKRAQDLQDTKPDKEAGAPKTVTMLDKPGGKPFEYQYDPKGNYSGDQGYGQWKKVGPAQANAASMGLIGTLTPLLGPTGEIQGTMNTKTGEIKPVAQNAVTGEGATTSSGARLSNTQKNQFNTQYVKPATDIEQNFQKFMGARHEYDQNPETGAASMAALAQHLGSTFGSIKGAQMGEHMIQEHKEAIGLMDRIGRYADQLATGQQLSKSQWDDFQKLITNTRDIQWETTAREAARRGQKVDFLPPDVHVQMADSAGHARYVRGDQVQTYLDQGAKIQ
jgi:hypothetical protein